MISNSILEKHHLRLNSLIQYCGYLALTLVTYKYAHQIFLASQNLFSTDFSMIYHSVQFYYSGQNIYSPVIRPLNVAQAAVLHKTSITLFSDLNTPFFILLLLPFAYLTYGNALLIWSLISFISMIVAVLLILRSCPTIWQNYAIRIWILVGFLIYFPTYANFCIGQISSIVLLITAGAWLACRKKYDIYAGVLLGFAFSFKLFFGLFLIFFLVRKQWLALIIMLITFLSSTVISILFFGIKTFQNYLTTLHSINWYASSWNASIVGFIYRIFGTNNNNNHVWVNGNYTTSIIYIIICLLLLSYYVWTIYAQQNKKPAFMCNQNHKELDWQFSLTIILMLLLSPLAWLYYFPLLLIPFITIIKSIHQSAHFNFYFCLLISLIILSSIPNSYQTSPLTNKSLIAFTSGSFYFYALILLFTVLLSLKTLKNKFNQEIPHIQKFTPHMQLLLYLLAIYPSLITFVIGSLHSI